MPSSRVSFPNARGQMLAAHLERPPGGEPLAYALFAHCFTCSKDLKAARTLTRALSAAGIAVLRFDFTGLGESEGDFAETAFSSNAADLVAAAKFLEEHHEAPQLLVGHSLGGAAVLLAAAELPLVRAVATLSAPCEPSHVLKLLEGNADTIRTEGEASLVLAGRRFTIKRQFLDDLEAQHMREVVAQLGRALLVLHAPGDNVVGIGNAADIFTAAKHPKSFVSLDAADHLLTREADARYAGEVIAAWARRYLAAGEPAWWKDVADNRVVARTDKGLRTDLRMNGHSFVADEPVSVGGTELGPTPYDLLAAALASCTGMTLRLYAGRKGWPLGAVTVGVTHSKVHQEDCESCDTKRVRLDLFERELELTGPLNETQRARLVEIANLCPVHRTLESEVRGDAHLRESSE
ncbi:MAG: Bll2902 protein [uncultured Truepera sp.]|uniref:Bll2902 protein n=1 Tax=uncultured Truepera sp. TaxID=543023 RepID=A0A6J4UQ23_9DEIN|nr:MAG: Bll2902 protein [uncultured Truepera sp.]